MALLRHNTAPFRHLLSDRCQREWFCENIIGTSADGCMNIIDFRIGRDTDYYRVLV